MEHSYLNQACIACIFRLWSNGCLSDSTLYVMTNILRAMATMAFCSFIRFANREYLLPRNDLFERAAAHAYLNDHFTQVLVSWQSFSRANFTR